MYCTAFSEPYVFLTNTALYPVANVVQSRYVINYEPLKISNVVPDHISMLFGEIFIKSTNTSEYPIL